MIELGNRRELFADRFLVDSRSNASMRLHHPQPANVALTFDKPWEGAFSGYVTVIHDEPEGIYRLYYRGWPDITGNVHEMEEPKASYCYAESRDGVTFTRPNLGKPAWTGEAESNIFLGPGGPASHSFSPFLDTNPNAKPEERFKALGSTRDDGKPVLVGFASGDGVNWKPLGDGPLIRYGAFDSQNVAFWSEHEGCYVSYYRFFTKKNDKHLWHDSWKQYADPAGRGYRSIARVTSDDFLNWSDPVQMFYGDTQPEQLYTNQTHPYFRAKHLYVALPKRFVMNKRFNSTEQAEQLGMNDKYAKDTSDGCFMTTRGDNQYDRTFMEAFVRPGLDPANWGSRTNMSALNVVPTGPTEMSAYYQHRYASDRHYLMRYTMRTDGFASINAGYDGGEMVTKPFTFQGNRLSLNLSTSSAGYAKVEVQNADGSAIDGFTLDDSVETFGDSLDLTARWANDISPGALAGKPVRLRFVLKDADLFSLCFTD